MDEQTRKKVDLQNWATLSRSILNGVVGDYLAKENNPLAIEMAFYHQNRALILTEPLAEQMYSQALSNKVIVLIHGLTNLETVWDFKSKAIVNEAHQDYLSEKPADNINLQDNYGLRLQENYGFTPFYLRYNTGLSIKENGQKLNALLVQLTSVYPIDIDEIVLMGFSMGGLLARSAQQLAQDTEAQWLQKLTNCYYIGTPHEGSPLEKFGHLASSVVRMVPREYISHWADWIDVRSEGIQDLKHGLLNLNKQGLKQNPTDNDDPYEQSKRCGSFYSGAQHHFISGALSENENSLINKFFGDSLVRHSSANPISAPQDAKTAHFDGIPHIPLAHSRRVYAQIKQWFEEHEANTELKFYDALSTPTKQNSNLSVLSDQAIISGAIDLLTMAYGRTIDTVEKVHRSIADEPFNMLKKIPVVSEVSKPVTATHKEILDTIYFSLKAGGKLVQEGAKLISPKDKKLKT